MMPQRHDVRRRVRTLELLLAAATPRMVNIGAIGHLHAHLVAAELRATAADLDRIVPTIDQLVTDLNDCAAQSSVPPDVRRCTLEGARPAYSAAPSAPHRCRAAR
jgi:hypothetical protein